jgi:hypothetical protein
MCLLTLIPPLPAGEFAGAHTGVISDASLPVVSTQNLALFEAAL